MTDHPILYSAPMVRAKLAGLKTQTRRVLKIKGFAGFYDFCISESDTYDWEFRRKDGVWNEFTYRELRCLLPHQIGDRLWARETWAAVGSFDPQLVIYRANYPECVPEEFENVPPIGDVKWRPSIFMPRKYSRMTDVVTEVRVQRLQDISCADAIAEGIAPYANSQTIDCDTPDPRKGFQSLWESINGPGSWALNPWVVAYTTEQHNVNIERMK